MTNDQVIYVVDRMVAKPGQAEKLFARYIDEYVPWATQLGLTLRHRWISPPVWLHEQSNTITMVWSVQGVSAYWAVEQQVRWDPSTSDFWRDIQPMIDHRTRSVMAEAEDMEALAHV